MRDGSSAEYWRLSPVVHFDILTKSLEGIVMLYVNETARRADKLSVPIPQLEVVEGIPRAHLEGQVAVDAMATGDPRPALYAAIKADAFFTEATDV